MSRFIAITLTETEWRALRTIEPDPTAWVKQQIDRRLAEAGVALAPTEGDAAEKRSREAHAC